MSAPTPILAQLKPQGRHILALRAVEHDVLEPQRFFGRRPIFGDPSEKARLSKEDANRQRALGRHYIGQLRRIGRLAREGENEELKKVAANVLNSRAAKASVLARLAFKDGLSYTLAQIDERAAKLNVNDVCHDPVVMILKEKDNGSFRTTLKFGWRHKARQMLVRDILYAAGVCNEYDYNFRAHGPQRAIERIVEAVKAGYHFWLTLDIKDCFASVKPEHLYGMTPLKGAVLKRVAFLPPSVPIRRSHTHASIPLEQDARRGLPQGSKASGPFASALLGREIRLAIAGHPGVVVVIFGDDIAIGARTQGQIEAIKQAIGERFASLSGGPLFLKFCKIAHANSAFDFVQRRIQRRQWDGEYEVRVQPSLSAFERLKKKMLAKYGGQFALGEAWEKSPDGVKERIQRWAAAMGWKMQPDWEEAILIFCLAY